MANGRSNGSKGDAGRDGGGFVAVPWAVLDSSAYASLAHPSRSLLMEIARQFVRDNNGRLLASGAYLAKRGWKSSDVITKAKRELIDRGFIFETVKGQRPNKASWYAVTWRALDKHPGYDEGAAQCFHRGAYRQNAPLTPSGGVGKASIGPAGGVGGQAIAPSGGPMRALSPPLSTPSHGDHLEKPSVAVKSTAVRVH